MQFTFKTILEFNEYFKTEKDCYLFLEEQWWSENRYCPHCGSLKKPYNVKSRGKDKTIPSYRCSESLCNLPFTIKTKSIFDGTKIELRKWLHALFEITIGKKGISSIELGNRIGISQKSSWLMLHKIRNVMNEENDEKFDGVNQLDETFVGGKNKNRHKDKKVEKSQGRSFKDKTPVLGIVNVGINEYIQRPNKVEIGKMVKQKVIIKPDKIKLFVIRDTSSQSIHHILKNNIKQGSAILTDEWMAYNNLDDYFHRFYVDHSKGQYVDGVISTNKVENFWSIFKRGLIGIYHSVKSKHLQKYCNEFQLRYNTKSDSIFDRFLNLISKTLTERITYVCLTKLKYT